MEAKAVRVEFPTGLEQTGIEISETVLEVGPTGGTLLNAGDVLVVDGARRKVTEVKPVPTSAYAMGHPETRGWDQVFRVTHDAA